MSALTQVDFYATQEADFTAVFPLIAKIVEKAYKQQMPVFLYCQTEQYAKQTDDFLWTFGDISFLPHAILEKEPQAFAPILIGYSDVLPKDKNILINLADPVPSWHTEFKRVIEVVYQDNKSIARTHYKAYQALGVELKSHSV